MFLLFIDEASEQRALLTALRRAGFDCPAVSEAGRQGLSDEEQLAFATAEGRVFYTRNTGDFVRLDAVWRRANRTHAGIIVVTSRGTPIGLQLRALRTLAAKFDGVDMVDRLEFLLNYG